MNKSFTLGAHTAFLAALLLSLLSVGRTVRSPTLSDVPVRFNGQGSSSLISKEGGKEEIQTELYPTGSSLPDCSHACGPCFPCKRVMVSFKCSTVAESCPIVYRCMCKGRYYHVPSN
ncbi:PREDICTED: protein EPIDERMAL PATTERNING FACTOR 2-like [Nelumbo nucifera]|uniref:Epidermal patterning factor-like protein n=1 Tax=Nelumbo nucifera TaxID=4432 RepID=A0A1U8A7U1_NELNU|nr:PREDICTED: protein EPIDERMAL PATTERNING FACTOR 2-like [Nelumbo nucifera]